MQLTYIIGIVFVAVFHDVSCQGFQRNQPDAQPDPSNAANLEVVANSVTNLAQKISLAISNPKSKTEIFSPVSIAGALSLLLLGSGGTTKDELMKLMGFQNEPISFTDIHKSFGKLFRELVSNDPSMQANVPWRETDKCTIMDEEDEDEMYHTRGGHNRPKRGTDDIVEVTIGNGIFAQEGQSFDAKYQTLAEQLYKTNLTFLDFGKQPQKAIAVINDWVRVRTKGKINEIVSQLTEDTILMIANTLYFNADWQEPFLKTGTKPRKFFPNGPNAPGVDVQMMVHGGCFPYYYWQQADTHVLGIPYKKNHTMYVFLPKDSDRNKLRALQTKINAATINDIIGKMQVKSASVQFPKMQVVNSFSLKEVFEQLGAYSLFDRQKSDLYRVLSSFSRWQGGNVEDIFDLLEDTKENAVKELLNAFPECLAPIETDVSSRTMCDKRPHCRYGAEICVCCPKTFGKRRRRKVESPPEPIFVNEVLHKVNMVVNEKGTEAGAVTATLLDRMSSQVNFRANGPFLMLIRDETTKLPLFYGSIYQPTL